MAVKVYAWPPVPAVGREWTVDAPVSMSRSALTGRRYASAAQPARRLASLTIHGRVSYGAGYMEALKRYLDGGINLVRLSSCKIPVGKIGVAPDTLRSTPLEWEAGGVDLDWTSGGTPLVWYAGTPFFGTVSTVAGVPRLTVFGLPPNTLIALPGEFLTIYLDEGDQTGETHMIAAPATTNSAGSVSIRLVTLPSFGGRVSFGTSETAVFEVEGGLPRAMRPANLDWTYSWSFREVFANEVGGFTEINPWL